jgi:hypothetical protein
LKPFGAATSCVALSSTQPSSSPLWFRGASTSAANLPPSSSTALIVSASMSACAGIIFNSSTTLSTSCITNFMSRNGGVYWGMGWAPRGLDSESGS